MKTKTLLELLKKYGVHIYDNDEALISEVETEYKNQFSQLPASVTDEQIAVIIDKAVHGARNEWTSHDEEENGKGVLIKEMRSLLNHPPVMGEGWVSVKERLPEALTEVLVYPEYNDTPVQAYFKDGKWKGSVEVTEMMKDGYVNDREFIDIRITHWMPLPKNPPTHQANT